MPNRTLLLIGAGHAHLEVLRRFARHPVPGTDLVVVTREPASSYSGMLPGLIAGQYTAAEAQIPVAPLAAAAGARLLVDEALSLDPAHRRVLTRANGILAYDLLSMNVGSRPNVAGIAGAAEHAIPVKPIDRFLARFQALRARVEAGTVRHVAVVGGGAAGVELILALEHCLRGAGRGPAFTLVTERPAILGGYPDAFRARLSATLGARHITVRADARVVAVTDHSLVTATGPLAADAVLLTTEAAAPRLVASSGLPVDGAGFLRVGPDLRALGADSVFAAGDLIAFDPPIPRAGVMAVRAAPVLAHNLRAALQDRALRPFRPQRRWLTIIGDAAGGAIATRNGLVVGGPWVWAWKQRIDRRFMARYHIV